MLVFVYGSLKKDYWNHCILGGSEFITDAVTIDPYILTDCGFPYLITPESLPEGPDKPNPAPVVGEVYLVVDEHIQRSLDALEGVPNHYQHLTLDVMSGEGQKLKCLAYCSANPEIDVKNTLCELDMEWNYVWRD